MYKKIIFTLLLFLTPIAFIEHLKKDSSSQIINRKYDFIGKNKLHLTNSLFEDNENRTEINNCWEEGDLLSQKRYCLSNENVFNDF